MTQAERTFLAIVMLVQAPLSAFANFLPITFDQATEHRNAVSGGGTCVTTGSYDADTFLWEQFHTCGQQELTLLGNGETNLTLLSEVSTLAAFVDDDGDVLGGSFTWFAQIPEFGMSAPELLGFGNVVNVLYVDGELEENTPDIVGTHHALLALVELEFVYGDLADLGPFVLWQAYNQVLWPDCLEAGDGLPGFTCRPWSTSISYDRGANWTGTMFHYLDRAVLVHEPGTLALLSITFAGLGLARLRNRTR